MDKYLQVCIVSNKNSLHQCVDAPNYGITINKMSSIPPLRLLRSHGKQHHRTYLDISILLLGLLLVLVLLVVFLFVLAARAGPNSKSPNEIRLGMDWIFSIQTNIIFSIQKTGYL